MYENKLQIYIYIYIVIDRLCIDSSMVLSIVYLSIYPELWTRLFIDSSMVLSIVYLSIYCELWTLPGDELSQQLNGGDYVSSRQNRSN